MQVQIMFTTSEDRDGIFEPQSGRLEIFDRPDETGEVWGSNVFARTTVTSMDGDRVTSELAPDRVVTFKTANGGFELSHFIEHVAVVIDGVTVWSTADEVDWA